MAAYKLSGMPMRTIIEKHKGHFFDKATMRFFRSRLHGHWYGDYVFVTSEQQQGFLTGNTYPRRYTVRQWCPEMDTIKTIGEFQQYETLSQALTAIKQYIRKA